MKTFELLSNSDEETRSLGEALGSLAEPGDVFLLSGNLGAGKTTMTQGIAKGLGVDGYASSPTFTLVNEYNGRLQLYHVDLYRLANTAEVYDLGLDEYFFGEGVAVVEWADRALDAMPDEHLLISLEYRDENKRSIRLDAIGRRYEILLDKLGPAYSS